MSEQCKQCQLCCNSLVTLSLLSWYLGCFDDVLQRMQSPWWIVDHCWGSEKHWHLLNHPQFEDRSWGGCTWLHDDMVNLRITSPTHQIISPLYRSSLMTWEREKLFLFVTGDLVHCHHRIKSTKNTEHFIIKLILRYTKVYNKERQACIAFTGTAKPSVSLSIGQRPGGLDYGRDKTDHCSSCI